MPEVYYIPERRTIAPAIGRSCVLLFSISLLLLSLYAVGSAQAFLDATLLWLLRLLEIALVLTAFFALCACCLYAWHAISGRRWFAAVPSLLSLLGAVIAIVLLTSLRMVSAVFGGSVSSGSAVLLR